MQNESEPVPAQPVTEAQIQTRLGVFCVKADQAREQCNASTALRTVGSSCDLAANTTVHVATYEVYGKSE